MSSPYAHQNPYSTPETMWLQSRYPLLQHISWTQSQDADFVGGRFIVPHHTNTFTSPTILVGKNTPEQCMHLKETRKKAILTMAEQLHVSFEEISGEIINAFIIFHEAGHAVDFLENIPSPDAWHQRSLAQFATLPIPHITPRKLRHTIQASGGFETWMHTNPLYKERCEKYHIINEEQLYDLQETNYRNLPKEAYADTFAAKNIPLFLEEAERK